MKKILRTLPVMLAVCMLFLYSCEKEEDKMPNALYTDVTASIIKSDLVVDASISPYEAIFDVSPAYDQGHLPFATNVGSVDALGGMLSGLDKSKTYLVYCHGDAPSIAAAELMVENEFMKVHRLEGNYDAWDKVSFVDVAAAKVKSKIEAGDFKAIFDVSPLFTEGHLPGTTNANASGGGTTLAELIEGMDKTKSYLVYCHGDAPSIAGAQLMEDAGFENVFRLEGNYGAWVGASYDVEINYSYTDVMASKIKSDLVDDASISPYEAIFDVSPAYDQGHLPFATNVGSVDALGGMISGLDKSLTYLVYCHGDAPSIAAAELMIENGFMKVHRLEGNYGAWDKVSFVDVAAAKVKSKIEAGDFKAIFDVSPLFTEGHLPSATNANASGGGTALAELIEGMDKTKSYLVYCHGDAPSMAGAQLMEDAGFENVYRLEGNYGAWVGAGYDVELKSYTDVMASQIKSDLVDDASISPYEAIFDVSPAYEQGHLPFATNVGSVDALGGMLSGLDKNLSYLVYCHGDAPSIAAAELMIENGFMNVHRLEGNYGAWDKVSFVDVAAATVKSKIDAGDFKAIFDVSPLFTQGHLPGATNANASGGGTALADLIEGMDKTKSYLVYCHGDAPSMAGAQLMEDAGFENVYRLEGNYGAWVDAGYDVE